MRREFPAGVSVVAEPLPIGNGHVLGKEHLVNNTGCIAYYCTGDYHTNGYWNYWTWCLMPHESKAFVPPVFFLEFAPPNSVGAKRQHVLRRIVDGSGCLARNFVKEMEL